MPEPLRVGLVGLGAIGQGIVDIVNRGYSDEIDLVAAIARDPSRDRSAGSLKVVSTFDDLLNRQPEVIVEVAGHEALREYGSKILRAGCDLLLVSVGALATKEFEQELLRSAKASGRRVMVASGAIGGLDALGAAAIGGLERVIHITRKPPQALLDPTEANGLSAVMEVFRGSAREGAVRFPESINVAAAVSLAGIGFDRTEVVVLADPGIDRNQHEVEAAGTFGSLRFEIRNVPNESNPRSTKLVAMSVVHQLLQRDAVLTVG